MSQVALLDTLEIHPPVIAVSDVCPPGCARIHRRWRHVGPLELRQGPPTKIGRPRKVREPLTAIQCIACGRAVGTRLATARLHDALVSRIRFWSGEQLELLARAS